MDQAEGLRAKNRSRPVQVLAVTSGKGGVGKTSTSVNLALSLCQLGRNVMLLDADLGLANADVMLGLQPRYNLGHLLAGKCSLADTLVEGPHGLKLVPASSGQRGMSDLTPVQQAGLIRAFSELDMPLDSLIVDCPAGTASTVMTFAQAAQEVIVVVCDEPASMTDAYALIKLLALEHGVQRFKILCNQTRSAAEGRDLFGRLTRVTDRFLDVALAYLGQVPHDEWLRRAVQQQRSVLTAYPGSPSATAYRKLAEQVDRWAVPRGPRGNLEFFVERMVQPGYGAALGAVA